MGVLEGEGGTGYRAQGAPEGEGGTGYRAQGAPEGEGGTGPAEAQLQALAAAEALAAELPPLPPTPSELGLELPPTPSEGDAAEQVG